MLMDVPSRSREVLVLILALSLIILSPVTTAKPSFFKQDSPKSELQELEDMFSGMRSQATSSREIVQLYGGQALNRSEPASPIDSLFNIPHQDYFRNDSIFIDFLRMFEEDLAPPQINLTWREEYLDGFESLFQNEKKQ